MTAGHHAPTCVIETLQGEWKDMKGKTPPEGEGPVEGVLLVVAPEPGLLGVALPVVAPEPVWQGVPKARDTIREVGISNGGGRPLYTDTMGAKVTEGPRASKNGAGGESPGEDE